MRMTNLTELCSPSDEYKKIASDWSTRAIPDRFTLGDGFNDRLERA
jgi:hypothetical protein